MLQRFNILAIASAHYRAVNKPGTHGNFDWFSLILTAALPLGIAITGFVLGWTVDFRSLSPFLVMAAFLMAAMITLFVFLANFRIKMMEVEALSHRRHLAALVSQVSASCLYTAAFTFIAGIGSIIAAVYTVDGPVHSALVGIMYGVFAHLGMTLLTILKRLWAIYEDLFRRDLIQSVSSIEAYEPEPRRKAQ